MTISPVSISQDIYAGDTNFECISEKKMTEHTPTVIKRIYMDSHSLIWRIGQIALAALVTLATVGLIMCTSIGLRMWKKAIDRFKHHVVYVNDSEQSSNQKTAKILPVPNLQTVNKPVLPSAKPVTIPPSNVQIATPPKQPVVLSVSDKNLLKKYEEIFAKYVITPEGNLLIKGSNKDSGLTENSLLKIVKEADKIADTNEVKTNGQVIKVDKEKYIVKVDTQPNLKDRKVHIICCSQGEYLKQGNHGIIKKVLVVSSGIMGVLKYINVNANDPVEESDYIVNESETLEFIHKNGEYSGFQHAPITRTNIHDVNESHSYVGYVSYFYEKGDLLSQLEKFSFDERLVLANDLIDHAAKLWQLGLSHSDYRLENIFVEEVNTVQANGIQKKKTAIRLGDFGFSSKHIGCDKNRICFGTHYSQADVDAVYKARAKINPSDKELKDLLDKLDVMGLGGTLYSLLVKSFGNGRPYEMPWRSPFPLPPLIDAGCPPKLANLIITMLNLNPKNRPSMDYLQSLWKNAIS